MYNTLRLEILMLDSVYMCCNILSVAAIYSLDFINNQFCSNGDFVYLVIRLVNL